MKTCSFFIFEQNVCTRIYILNYKNSRKNALHECSHIVYIFDIWFYE